MKRYWQYSILRSSECDTECAYGETSLKTNSGIRSSPQQFYFKLIICLLLIAIALISGVFVFEALPRSKPLSSHTEAATPHNSKCTTPSIRKEWRSLTKAEKHSYFNAIHCLRDLPSAIHRNHSHYDDFPYVHMHFGNITHDTAGFLPWHRYFVLVYERSLREKCGFAGHVPYWDWSLDWANFKDSPVFDPVDGFGGDGGSDAPKSVGEGRCVVDGPFASLQLLYSNMRLRPHCLSRGFPSEKELRRWTAGLRPEVVEQVLTIEVYSDLFLALENGPHLSIPYSIRGDFYRFTAPNDPIFFLHHSQLDRLWSRWQIEKKTSKVHWGGAAWDGSEREAGLSDLLRMGGLALDIPASNVLNIDSDELCYRY
ncbi:hypothetical protein MMC14_009391 [Varicellaria rhodocarpa]|nr:hypothetical protein [Varicellaria rhodocarpa]